MISESPGNAPIAGDRIECDRCGVHRLRSVWPGPCLNCGCTAFTAVQPSPADLERQAFRDKFLEPAIRSLVDRLYADELTELDRKILAMLTGRAA